MAADTTKQVRVDNWAVFFLQRLQLFFSKTDYCDMTLQFNGNVQLKVHKLVINACTDYFQLLEQTCLIDENTILMPADLQADVIVPIINFMYTGMLEFQLSLYEKLYKTAQTMNITILTKLLEAQKLSVNTAMKSGNNKKKQIEQQTYSSGSSSGGNTNTATKMKAIQHIDLPAPLPGRKLPIWKRKSLPTTTTTTTTTSSSSSSSTTTHHHHHHHHDKWSLPPDPLSLPDNTPKPTRFEWPDDELPNLPLMDTSYESVSLTSKPLLTQEEEIRGGGGGGSGNNTTTSTIFDDLKQLPNASHTTSSLKTKPTIKTTLDMEEMKNYIKEQKIRSGLSNTTNNDDDDDDIIDNDLDYNSNDSNISNKRKIDDKTTVNKPVKRVRFSENIDGKTTISITTDGKSNSKLDHNKIVTEILKKYPQLVKENKNIRLKIMSKNRNVKESEKIITTNINKQARSTARFNKSIDIGESSSALKSDVRVGKKSKDIISTITNNDTEPWVCVRCSTADETVEFVLYYLYRKHMTDFHNEKFDARSCKYCGHFCNKNNILYYHLYIKHGMRPPSNYNFPKCNQCPYIALTQDILNRHRLRHNINEQQCSECKLAFSSHIALTSHIQITGHTGKTNKTNFDCQYCTKRYQSSVGLFIHVRMQHRNEAMRDGIVSIDEDDDYYSDENEDDDDDDNDNDNIDDNEQNDEYILPEIVNAHHHSKKVNILSNVKVTPTHIQQQQQQPNQTNQQLLEPSSEAEALNNVASGIATSLGLVDIVVLNDNQQIYLQSNDQQANFNHNQQQQQQQEEQQQQENDQQTEFILPELSTTTTNRNEQSQQQQQQQVITTDGVITQSMLTNNDIASTDELVMVLTDHDYGDGNQDEMNSDNSNIVVLYSHPVEGGQQEQYITSQGNIMVNSRTGMIEIRNSAPVCPSTNQQQQIVIEQQPEQSHQQQQQQESHIESIEMIQREIESHTNDTTTNVTIDEDKSKDDTQIDDNGEESKQIDENIDKLENDSVDVKDEEVDNDNNKTIETTIKEPTTDNIINDSGDNIDNQETIDDIVEKSNDQEIVVEDKEKEQKSIDDEPTIPEPQLPEITDSTIEKDDVPQLDNSIEETSIESKTVLEQDEDKKIEEQEEEIQKDISDDLDTTKETVDNQNDDNKTNDNDNKTNNDEISNDTAREESGINESNSSLFSSLHLNDDDDDDDDRTDKNQSNTATISDDNIKQSMKIAILDDWEDTDSQQSDSKDDKKTTSTTNTTTAIINSTIITTTTTTTAVVATDETVNKLMDDWADEDEDESKKE